MASLYIEAPCHVANRIEKIIVYTPEAMAQESMLVVDRCRLHR